MTKRNRKTFTKEQKDWAVDEFIAGSLSVDQIAEQLRAEPQYIYRWKVLREEKLKGLRVEELTARGNSIEESQRIFELELEVDAYKKKFAEQVLISDLLKKLLKYPPLQRESELTELLKTIKAQELKRRQSK